MGFVMYFDMCLILIFALIWIGTVTTFRYKRKKSLVYLLFFTLFYIYLFKVLDYTLFQFQSLVFLKYFIPNLQLQGQEAGREINLVPLLTLTQDDLKTSFLNILLFIPFGFGLPFITRYRMKKIVVVGLIFSVLIELSQLITGLVAKITFRVTDVNDVIFNTAGVVIGYILFVIFIRMYRYATHNKNFSSNSILHYIGELDRKRNN